MRSLNTALSMTIRLTRIILPRQHPRFQNNIYDKAPRQFLLRPKNLTDLRPTNSRNMSISTHHQHQQPSFSANYDAKQGDQDLAPLLRENGGRWTMLESGKGVERTFKFKTFKKTWEFMNIIAAECAVKKHHPEWSNVYNTTFIRWTTHSPPGLSEKDVLMARYCDEQAALCGELEPVGEIESGSAARNLATRVVVEGGDCCVPKKKTES